MKIDFAPHPYERDVWVGVKDDYVLVVWGDHFNLRHNGNLVGQYAHIHEALQAIQEGKK